MAPELFAIISNTAHIFLSTLAFLSMKLSSIQNCNLNMSDKKKCLWGGRFIEGINRDLETLNRSLDDDARLFSEDLTASKAYARALAKAKAITHSECDQICNALELIRFDWIEKAVKFEDSDEDIHSVNERLLVKLCGIVGEKLHTGRSRNDQSVTDVRMWTKRAIHELIVAIGKLIEAILTVGMKYKDVLMPGYTHLQRAQPVRFAHWIFSHAFSLLEDCSRFRDLFRRVDVLPLGSGALAGNPLGVDREYLAKLLGFSAINQNSMHAVADRDYIVEFNFVASLTSLHLSRFAEDLIIFCTKEFNFVKISDAFSTGSSLMPQKRNPDSLELVRGMSGTMFGSMAGFMMTLKGLPSTYNKDLQLDKKALFNSFDSLMKILRLMEGVIQTIHVNADECEKALSPDMFATDWAYYLVKKGVPFRTAHHIVGQCVARAEQKNESILELTKDDLKSISDMFSSDLDTCCSFIGSVEQYTAIGGTSSRAINEQLDLLQEAVAKIKLCKQINQIYELNF